LIRSDIKMSDLSGSDDDWDEWEESEEENNIEDA
jgi:hypothetical protein